MHTLKMELKASDSLEGTTPLTPDQLANRMKIKDQLLSIAEEEKVFWRQKCKLKWLKDGVETSDSSSIAWLIRKDELLFMKSFQGKVTACSNSDIEGEFFNFYKSLYSRKDGHHFFPLNLQWDPIPLDSSHLLEKEFTEEVYKTILNLGD